MCLVRVVYSWERRVGGGRRWKIEGLQIQTIAKKTDHKASEQKVDQQCDTRDSDFSIWYCRAHSRFGFLLGLNEGVIV